MGAKPLLIATAAAISAVCSAAGPEPGPMLVLVEDGHATGQVVAGEGEKDEAAALEFIAYVEKMTGVRLPLATWGTKSEAPALFVGTVPKADGVLEELQPGFIDDGSYVIAPVPGGMVVQGYGEGVWHGVYGLLYDMGCRFYMPAEACEHVPSRDRIVFPLARRVIKPAFAGRTFQFHGGEVLLAGPYDWDYRQWMRKVGLGGVRFSHGHAFESYISHEECYESHPEYFAMSNGKRLPNQLCLTNENVMNIITDAVRERFERGALSASLSANDATEYCECPECTAERKGEMDFTVNLLEAANRVAQALKESFPDRFICFYATYHGSGELPADTEVDPMVVPVFFPRAEGHSVDDPRCEAGKEFLAVADNWRRHGMEHFGIYDYLFMTTKQMASYPVFHAMASAIRASAERDALFWNYEMLNRSWLGNLHMYLAARLTWDPYQDVEALLDEFYRLFYGPAAPHMKRCYSRMEGHTASYDPDLHGIEAVVACWTPAIRAACQDDLEQAAAAVRTEIERERVNLARTNFALTLKSLDVERARVQLAKNETDENRQALLDSQEQLAAFHSGTKPLKLTRREYFHYVEQEVRPPSEYAVVMELPEYWRFAQDKADSGQALGWYAKDFDDSSWNPLSTRLFWEMQGYPDYDGYACYRTSFRIPEGLDADEPLYLYFGAVDDHAWVYVNGELAGSHAIGSIGWDRPFVIPVNEWIDREGEQVIAIRVWDMEGAGGIFRPVWLVTRKTDGADTVRPRVLR